LLVLAYRVLSDCFFVVIARGEFFAFVVFIEREDLYAPIATGGLDLFMLRARIDIFAVITRFGVFEFIAAIVEVLVCDAVPGLAKNALNRSMVGNAVVRL
jgi:hypothetical protein